MAVSLIAGRWAYLFIALAVLILTMSLVSSAFTSGVLWIVGMSTVTGFYQRLVLFRTGHSPASDYVRLALEISILFYFSLMAGNIISRLGPRTKVRVTWLDILVGLYLLISSLYAFALHYVGDPLITIYGWRWVCIPLLMYYIGRAIGARPGTLEQINKFIIVLLLLQACYGAYQAMVGFPGFEQPWIEQHMAKQLTAVEDSLFIAGKHRIPALTEGHTSASFLIPALFLWVLFSPASSSGRWRVLRRLALLSSLLYLVFSNERSAIGMVGVGIGMVIFLFARKKAGIGVFLVGIPALVLLLLGLSQIDPSTIPWSADTIVFRRLLELLNPFRSGTFAGRLQHYWPAYLERFLDNPIGYGLGSFHATTATLMSDWGRKPHNMYLQVLLETGLLGLLIFLMVLVVYFKYLYDANKMRLEPLQRGLLLGAASSFLAFLAIGMANQPIETFPLALLFWFLMGFVTSYLAGLYRQTEQRSAPQDANATPVVER